MFLWRLLLVSIGIGISCCNIGIANASTDVLEDAVKIGKCCEINEVLVNNTCTPISETNETVPWRPEFKTDKKTNWSPKFQLKIGLPRCGNNEHLWHVYHTAKHDKLAILPSGKLRHYIIDLSDGRVDDKGNSYDSNEDDSQDSEDMYYDYAFGDYCADKVILSTDHLVATYAMVCVPKVIRWTDTAYLITHAVNPTFHAVAIVSYLLVAIVYFVLPQLRDLVGNMITSMTLCLITSQCASMVRIFTEYGNHVSFLIADIVTYVSLLAAFFWLNALGYYVWNTFRSRNVFLRVTDGQKYCYYSSYVWGSTFAIAVTAIFAHFTLETDIPTVTESSFISQETIGWLGTAVLFTSIAFTIIVDLCFALTTANTMKRMSVYGRIHHKMKYSFKMFVFLFAIMSTGWLFLLLSRLQYDGLVYCYVVVNVLEALLILYVCVFGQRRVTFLLGKTCDCCNPGESPEGLDWGEEMTAMNAGY